MSADTGGWSSPWLAHTDSTIDLLVEAGFSYLLDLRMDDQPVWLKTNSNSLLAIPYALELNDSSTLIGRPADNRARLRDHDCGRIRRIAEGGGTAAPRHEPGGA